MKDMGEQLEDMSGELSKLRVENNSLKNRNTILEKVGAPETLTMRPRVVAVRRPRCRPGRLSIAVCASAACRARLYARRAWLSCS